MSGDSVVIIIDNAKLIFTAVITNKTYSCMARRRQTGRTADAVLEVEEQGWVCCTPAFT